MLTALLMMAMAVQGELLRAAWLRGLVAQSSELLAVAPSVFRLLLSLTSHALLSVSMAVVLGDVIEAEASGGEVVVLAVRPVLVSIEAASRGEEASLGAREVEEITVSFLQFVGELLELNSGLALDLSSELELQFVIVAKAHILRTHGESAGGHNSSGSNKSADEFHIALK